jgi:hypothetical protein
MRDPDTPRRADETTCNTATPARAPKARAGVVSCSPSARLKSGVGAGSRWRGATPLPTSE